MTGLIYIGCELYGFDNFGWLLPREPTDWQDADDDLKQLINCEPGMWRYPEKMRKQWRAEAENKRRAELAAARAALIEGQSPSLEERLHGKSLPVPSSHLGLIVDPVGKTVRRDGYPKSAVVHLAKTKFWPVFLAMFKAGSLGIEPRAAYELYEGSRDDCRVAVSYYRGIFTRLEITITNRKWALVDLKDLKTPKNLRS